jgi:hypothetical protein
MDVENLMAIVSFHSGCMLEMCIIDGEQGKENRRARFRLKTTMPAFAALGKCARLQYEHEYEHEYEQEHEYGSLFSPDTHAGRNAPAFAADRNH